ncbi:exo-beta-1,3-glucanase [Telmatospirillum sp. J64-1]|uniref:glycoside hydrolase family 17 protein n=1 Tax=Telmatospirillum sp. J64-1 TaxID=2502183 RepID=UPI00115DFFCD|nr:exo-beta-1,3-glucanase [Telmatospirillum sp. J64-1]
MRKFLFLFLVAIVAVVNFALWGWLNRPVDVGIDWAKPVQSMSFAPFRKGQSPLEMIYPSPEQVEEDLLALKGQAEGVRVYTSQEGMEVLPDLARKHGFDLTFSAWLGVTPEVNEAEVTALIEAANAHPDVIKRVIVGNEVLLRGDLTPEELIAFIRRVKAEVQQPVSYADVWAFFLKYPEVAEEVDFLTIHILPYWEDEPVSVRDAERHLIEIYDKMALSFPDKPLMIGESGWPTMGRDRGPAQPGVANAAHYVRSLAKVAEERGIQYNVVEAFDQYWKSKLEGTVGGAWGVLDVDRRVKFTMSGPVVENPDWPFLAAGSAALGAVAALVLFWRRREEKLPGLIGGVAAASLLSALLLAAAHVAAEGSFSPLGHLGVAVRILLLGGFVYAVLAALRVPEQAPTRLGQALLLALAGIYVTWAALLAWDGRYRDIPYADVTVLGVGIALLSISGFLRSGLAGMAFGPMFGGVLPAAPRFADKAVAGLLLLGAIAACASEGIALARGQDFITLHPELSERVPLILKATVANTQMNIFAFMLILTAIPFWANGAALRRGGRVRMDEAKLH